MSEPVFVDGPALSPAAELARWLDEHKNSLLRLPLVVELRSYEVGSAWIGMTTDDPPPDAIWVELDQGALSVGLTERLVPLCPQTPTRCVTWIEGYWGPTIDLPGPLGFDSPDAPAKQPFSVREVIDLVREGDSPHIKVVERG
jgi:hypothetical protein